MPWFKMAPTRVSWAGVVAVVPAVGLANSACSVEILVITAAWPADTGLARLVMKPVYWPFRSRCMTISLSRFSEIAASVCMTSFASAALTGLPSSPVIRVMISVFPFVSSSF